MKKSNTLIKAMIILCLILMLSLNIDTMFFKILSAFAMGILVVSNLFLALIYLFKKEND